FEATRRHGRPSPKPSPRPRAEGSARPVGVAAVRPVGGAEGGLGGGPGGHQNRCRVWLKVPLPKASTLAGVTANTSASPPSWWKEPSWASNCHCPSHLVRQASARRASS